MSEIFNNSCPYQGEGTNVDALGLVFHHKCPTFINACRQAVSKVGVMICQGGLRSPSALSSYIFFW